MGSPAETRYWFPQGVPAFEQDREFVLAQEAEWRPFATLTSVRDGGPRFVCIEVAAVQPGYCAELSAEDAGSVSAAPGRVAAQENGLRLYAIVTAGEDGTLTANLAAPIVLNPGAAAGVQAIQPGGEHPEALIVRPGQGGGAC